MAGDRFRQLDDAQIPGTLPPLRDCIAERFPGSGLASGAAELLALKTRLKRRRALAALHQLRSMAHTVELHQLTSARPG